MSTPKRRPSTPGEAAQRLVELIRRENVDIREDVLVVTVVCDGGLLGGKYQATDHSRLSGRRITRFIYDWEDLRDSLADLTRFAEPGQVLRARVRQAALGTDALAVQRRIKAGVT